MVLSSVKLQIFVFSVKRKTSLINKLNNNGPTPKGFTPNYFIPTTIEPIFILCFRCDR